MWLSNRNISAELPSSDHTKNINNRELYRTDFLSRKKLPNIKQYYENVNDTRMMQQVYL
jgi:hypothetical protein